MELKTTHIDGDLSVSRHTTIGGRTHIQSSLKVGHNVKVEGWLEARNIRDNNKGVYRNEQALNAAYPEPEVGWWAIIIADNTENHIGHLYIAEGGKWVGVFDENKQPVYAGNPELYLPEIEDLDNRLSTAEDKIDANYSEISTRIDSLSQEQGEQGEDIALLKDRVDAIEPKVAEHTNAISAMEGTIASLSEQTAELSEDLNAEKLKIEENRQNIEANSETINNISSTLDTVAKDTQVNTTKIDGIEAYIESHKGEYNTLKERADAVETELGVAKDEISNHTASLSKLDERMIVAENEISSAKNDINIAKESINSLEETTEAIQSSIGKANGIAPLGSNGKISNEYLPSPNHQQLYDGILTNQHEIEALKPRTSELEQNLSRQTGRINALDYRVNNLHSITASLENSLSEEIEDVNNLKQTTNTILNHLEAAKGDIKDLEESTDHLDGEIDKLREHIFAVDNEVYNFGELASFDTFLGRLADLYNLITIEIGGDGKYVYTYNKPQLFSAKSGAETYFAISIHGKSLYQDQGMIQQIIFAPVRLKDSMGSNWYPGILQRKIEWYKDSASISVLSELQPLTDDYKSQIYNLQKAVRDNAQDINQNAEDISAANRLIDTNTTNIAKLNNDINNKIGINSSIGDNVSIPSNFQLAAMGEQVSELNDRAQTSLNNFIKIGLYRLRWEVTESPEETNLPMLNHGGGNTIDAMLWVLDSSLPNVGAKDDDVCVTQFLMLSNRTGGAEGEMFTRSAVGSTKQGLSWKRWEKYQTNVEVGMVTSLDEFVDNGIYSGVYNQGGQPTEIETFVVLVINNYAVANENKTITQIKYGTRVNGEFAMQTRSKGVATGGVWSEWQSVGGIDNISFSELYDTSAISPRCFALAIENGNVVIHPIFANLNGNYEGLVKAGDVRQYVTNQIKQAITDTLNKEV